jgi:putative ubiquitin-RnfH superfamily antitoxin RatB of RatAB toxin-antitoxin module
MATKAKSMEILLCDARQDPPLLEIHDLPFHDVQKPTVGWALQILGIANNQDDPAISRKGCYGVFGKRKDWDSRLYAGDRLELYAPLLIDPKSARRKKANRDKDSLLKAKALRRQAAKPRP